MSYDDDARAVETRLRHDGGRGLDVRRKQLWQALEALDNAVDTLTVRVGPVLLPERPAPALSGIDADAPQVSELGNFLDQVSERLGILGSRVSELSVRVDL